MNQISRDPALLLDSKKPHTVIVGQEIRRLEGILHTPKEAPGRPTDIHSLLLSKNIAKLNEFEEFARMKKALSATSPSGDSPAKAKLRNYFIESDEAKINTPKAPYCNMTHSQAGIFSIKLLMLILFISSLFSEKTIIDAITKVFMVLLLAESRLPTWASTTPHIDEYMVSLSIFEAFKEKDQTLAKLAITQKLNFNGIDRAPTTNDELTQRLRIYEAPSLG